MKLEYGKRYVMRNGNVTGVLKKCSVNRPFTDGHHSWHDNGSWDRWSISDYDLIEEYKAP